MWKTVPNRISNKSPTLLHSTSPSNLILSLNMWRRRLTHSLNMWPRHLISSLNMQRRRKRIRRKNSKDDATSAAACLVRTIEVVYE